MARKKIEKYVLDRTIHLGFIKETFGKGTVFSIDREKKLVEVDTGQIFHDLRDIDICVKAGYMVDATTNNVKTVEKSTDVSAPKPKEDDDRKPAPEMKVIRSDEDLMERIIDIKHTKNENKNAEKKASENMEILREGEADEIRGVRVIRKVADVEDYQEIGDPSGQISDGNAKVVAKIAKEGGIEVVADTTAEAPKEAPTRGRGRPKGSKNKPKTATAKKGKGKKVQQTASERKKQIAENRKKMAKEDKA